MIIRMIPDYEKELTDFLYGHILLKEYFIAWIPETYNEISMMKKDDFFLCMENEKVVGCLGTYISYEQKVARLLGPVIEKEYFDKYIDTLFQQWLKNLPEDITEIKIAFCEENVLCRHWCEKNGFELYNAEKTMVLDKDLFLESESPSSVAIKPYEPKYKEGLGKVHPGGAFFTLDELINAVSAHSRLLLAIEQDEVTGYVFYDRTEDGKQGAIELLHVREDKRNKGYGTALLSRAIKDLISGDVEQIFIDVRVNNTNAQRLYSRTGFTGRETVYAYRKHIGDIS